MSTEMLKEAEHRIEAAGAAEAPELNLSSLRLLALPYSVRRLKHHLKWLRIDSNRLTELPDWFAELSELETLEVSHNELLALPNSIAELRDLRRLYVWANQLTEGPEFLGTLRLLESLNLGGNQLRELPESIFNLTELRELSVRHNQLASLSASVTRLKKLRLLSLSNNQLTELPESIGKLSELQLLNVAGNQLTALPGSLRQLTNLNSLFLHENPRLDLPQEIMGPKWEEVVVNDSIQPAKEPMRPRSILDYYFRTREEQGRELREVKLIVVGRGSAGKTSLIRRLKGEALNRNENETHGIVISELSLMLDDGPVTTRVWDFGGQHVLHAMHEFFLTPRSLYLLVLSDRDDMAERDAVYWLQLIRSYGGGEPVVVALNKSHGRQREMDYDSLKKQFGPIIAWVPTECDESHPETIAQLRAAITMAVNTMPAVRTRFLAKWWRIKEWLERMTEPYIDFTAFQKLCQRFGEDDAVEQDLLAEWLHDLGVALNYSRDSRLHYDTSVLRPDWLANGIYAILRANDPRHPQKIAPDAILSKKRLMAIYPASEKLGLLDSKDYPKGRWDFILRLMKLFQLAFPLGIDSELLVPALLPLEPPAGADEPEGPERQRLRYEFRIVPIPLIPKFLVRTSKLIEEKLRWRRGVILRLRTARARVWATQDEHWIHVTVAGHQDDRDELLSTIRQTMAGIFVEYRNLHVVEQWEYEGDWVPRRTLELLAILPREREFNEVVFPAEGMSNETGK